MRNSPDSELPEAPRDTPAYFESALGDFGFPEEVLDDHAQDKMRKEYGRLICVCGHPISNHTKTADMEFCGTARMYCRCQNKVAVLEVEDKRCFMFKSEGYGPRHALLKGVHKSHKNGKKTRFLGEKSCFKCKVVSEILIPIGLDRHFSVCFGEAPYNGLFCVSCFEGILGRPFSAFMF